jgi:hypothetical protein
MPPDIPPVAPPGIPALEPCDAPPPCEDEPLLLLLPLLPCEEGDPPDDPPPGARDDVPPELPEEDCMPELLQAARTHAATAATVITRQTCGIAVMIGLLRQML